MRRIKCRWFLNLAGWLLSCDIINHHGKFREKCKNTLNTPWYILMSRWLDFSDKGSLSMLYYSPTWLPGPITRSFRSNICFITICSFHIVVITMVTFRCFRGIAYTTVYWCFFQIYNTSYEVNFCSPHPTPW
jgi:hypothetical protein